MNTVIHIKSDKKIKEQAQKTAQELGLSLSAVINAQLRQFVRTKSLFVWEEARPMSRKLERELKKVEDDIKTGKNIFGPFRTAEELVNHLKRQ